MLSGMPVVTELLKHLLYCTFALIYSNKCNSFDVRLATIQQRTAYLCSDENIMIFILAINYQPKLYKI